MPPVLCTSAFALSEVWRFPSGATPVGSIFASPSVTSDGGVLVASTDGTLYALHPDGTLNWSHTLPGSPEIRSTPAISIFGWIYFGDDDGNFHILKPDGTPYNTFTEAAGSVIRSAPAIDQFNYIYFTADDGFLYKLNSLGTKQWQTFVAAGLDLSGNPEDELMSSPVIGQDGAIYVAGWRTALGATSPRLSKVDPSNGAIIWEFFFTEENSIEGSPSVDDSGRIYIGIHDEDPQSFGATVYGISPDGVQVCACSDADNDVKVTPVIGNDGSFYFGSDDNFFYASNPDGSQKWASPFQTGIVCSSAAIDSNGTIYVGRWDPETFFGSSPFFALNTEDGTEEDRVDLVGGHYASPAIDREGNIYVGTLRGFVYKLNHNSSRLVNSAWPMFGRSVRHRNNAEIQYQVVDLGTFGGDHGEAFALNEANAVTGWALEAPSSTDEHAFLWEDGVLWRLGAYSDPQSYGTGINENTVICGSIESASTPYTPFRWDGSMVTLPVLSSTGASAPRAINDNGIIVGFAVNTSGVAEAVRWETDNSIWQLQSLVGSGGESYAYGVNQEGKVVGKSITSSGVFHAYMADVLGTIGPLDDLGTMAGSGNQDTTHSEARDVNDLGEVVGISENLSGEFHAFFKQKNTGPGEGFIDLGTLDSADDFSIAYAVNQSGTVVGVSPGGEPFIWKRGWGPGGMRPLKDQLAPTTQHIRSWDLESAFDINDAGDIVGSGYYSGNLRAILIREM